MTIQRAAAGAPRADCVVCGLDTVMRLAVGDGLVPLCSEQCAGAWPKYRVLEVRVAELDAAARAVVDQWSGSPWHGRGGSIDRLITELEDAIRGASSDSVSTDVEQNQQSSSPSDGTDTDPDDRRVLLGSRSATPVRATSGDGQPQESNPPSAPGAAVLPRSGDGPHPVWCACALPLGHDGECWPKPPSEARRERERRYRRDADGVEHGRSVDRQPSPLPMLLVCPSCSERHIDEGEFATRPHHTHACQDCGMVWRPAIVPTVGVRFLAGFKNESNRSWP